MYYVVLVDNTVVYLGKSIDEAKVISNTKNAEIHMLNSLEDLDYLMKMKPLHEVFGEIEQGLSDAAAFLAKKLDEIGVNAKSTDEFIERCTTVAEKTAVEVKSLGIKSMKFAGEGFVALGNFLKNDK